MVSLPPYFPSVDEIIALHHSLCVALCSVSVDKEATAFVSGSCDGSCKLWDIRSGECSRTFKNSPLDPNSLDINTIQFCVLDSFLVYHALHVFSRVIVCTSASPVGLLVSLFYLFLP